MLKLLFLCLLIANALLLALGLGSVVNPIFEARQPQRVGLQLNPARLKLVSAELATAPLIVELPTVVPEMKLDAVACLQWGTFIAADLGKVETRLRELSFGPRQSRQNVQENASNMVFIPTLGSKEAADKKSLELSHLGVRDFYIIQEPSALRWAISLGVFKTEDGARQQLANLLAKGVHSARIGIRTVETNKFNFVFRTVTASEHVELDKLKQDFPTQELRSCSKP